MHFDSIDPAVEKLGWNGYFHQQLVALLTEAPERAGSQPERVVYEQRGEYGLLGANGPRRASLPGRLAHELDDERRPCVGDFVLAARAPNAELARIEHVFERSSLFRRKAAGATSRGQPIAANVDVAIVVSSLAPEEADPEAARHGINQRRIERYLRAIAEAPAAPVIAVSKADLRADAQAQADELARELGNVDIVLVSAHTGLGLEELGRRLGPGVSAVLVGSSGAGKSSLINCLLGRTAQRVNAVREGDARGRHTTTHRELFVLPTGGLLIDTPGMRELALFADETTDESRSGFEDIDALAEHCRFRDCQHEGEPGCAVRAAVEKGELDRGRLEHSQKLQREIAWQKTRFDALKASTERKAHRAQSRAVRARQRSKRGE